MTSSQLPDGTRDPVAETVLCREVLEAARRAADERIRAAERQAAEGLADARVVAEREVEAYLATMAREADRRCASIRMAIPMEIRRGAAARREVELETIRAEALRRLEQRDAEERRADLLVLIPAALATMEGATVVLRLSPDDPSSGTDDFLARIGRSLASRSVRLIPEFDPGIPPGGVVIEAEGGGQRWDNTPRARCARLWPELRLGVAAAAGWLVSKGSP